MTKTVLITGASRGIGKETAIVLAENGYNVIINYHNSKDSALSLADKITSFGGNCIAIKADISNPSQVESMFCEAKKKYGKIDILINNAGIAKQNLFTDVSYSEWRNMFNVNMDGVFHCCQNALPDMIRSHEGKIINISSVWGIVGASCEVAYSSTKAAIIGFTKALAKEVGPSGIQVNCVAPGVIDTDMNSNLDELSLSQLKDETPLCRLGKVEDIANTILFLVSSKSDFITGQIISPNGGFVI